jgi:hypothetical protein
MSDREEENGDIPMAKVATTAGKKRRNTSKESAALSDHLSAGIAKLRQLTYALENHHHKHRVKTQLLVYIALIVVYVGIQVGLFAANFLDQDVIESLYYGPFHYLEFWAVFAFTTLEAYTLVSVDVVDLSNALQSGVLMFNIIITLLVAIMFSLWDGYEVPAHYIEYSVQILISMVDVFFVFQVLRNVRRDRAGGEHVRRQSKLYDDPTTVDSTLSPTPKQVVGPTAVLAVDHGEMKWLDIFKHFQGVIAVLAVLLSILQLFIYSAVLPVTIEAERAGHFCEFINVIERDVGFAVPDLVVVACINRKLSTARSHCGTRR